MSPKNKAVFLDRDGVINTLVYHREQEVIDSPFTLNQFKLLPAVPEALRMIRQAGYLAVVISNQPGLAKGHLTAETFAQITRKMHAELSKFGAALDAEYYCLHHPEAVVAQYQVDCDCRKPRPGLIFQAARDLDIDLPQSWLIGDNLSDIQAGQSAGCQTVLIGRPKCEMCHLMDEKNTRPDKISLDLLEAGREIISTHAHVSSQ